MLYPSLMSLDLAMREVAGGVWRQMNKLRRANLRSAIRHTSELTMAAYVLRASDPRTDDWQLTALDGDSLQRIDRLLAKYQRRHGCDEFVVEHALYCVCDDSTTLVIGGARESLALDGLVCLTGPDGQLIVADDQQLTRIWWADLADQLCLTAISMHGRHYDQEGAPALSYGPAHLPGTDSR